MRACSKCELSSTCKQVVVGHGKLSADIVLIGEAPGAEEDLEGLPFVGRSGKLLRKLMRDAGLNPAACYITNTVKCRPPGNATPTSYQVHACKGWLWEELKLVSPKVIITVGRVPTDLLLKNKPKTMKLAMSSVYSCDWENFDSYIMPCYHPSYLLRNGRKLDDMVVDRFKEAYELSKTLSV